MFFLKSVRDFNNDNRSLQVGENKKTKKGKGIDL